MAKFFSWSKLFSFLEFFSGLIGILFLIYGFYVLLIERSNVQVCSLEMLANQNEVLVAQQPRIVVEVMGAVNEVGVWQFNRDKRVGDALERAGGITSEADKEFVARNLNLAARLADGDKIYIPFNWEKEVDSSNSDLDLISINKSTPEELMSISGIGESRANSIIENRPYTDINELLDKKVLSESLLKEIVGLISL